MDQSTTVFNLSETVFANLIWLGPMIVIGIAIVTAALFGMRHVEGSTKTAREIRWPGLMLGFGTIWTTVTSLAAMKLVGSTLLLLLTLEGGGAEVVSGPVEVLREGSAGGHDSGDLVRVDGVEFQINSFTVQPGYSKIIAHGGYLREGVNVRIHFVGKTIVRVEILN